MTPEAGISAPPDGAPLKPGQSKRVTAIVPSAGQSTRLGMSQRKQMMIIGVRTVVEHTLHALAADPRIQRAIVVGGDYDFRHGAFDAGRLEVEHCTGGATRAESVLEGLRRARTGEPEQVVLVHDAVRPFLQAQDLARTITAGTEDEHGAILARRVTDTVKRGDHRIEATVPRADLWLAETPQVFRLELLLHALEAAAAAGVAITDEAGAMERAGFSPRLVMATHHNLKITYPADIEYAQRMLTWRP